MKEGTWDYEECWNETIRQFQQELTEQEYQMWFKNINYDKSEKSQIHLSVPSSFYKDQIIRRYSKKIENKIFELLGNKITINFTIKKMFQSTTPPPDSSIQENKKKPNKNKYSFHPQLNKEYTFESFVIGDNNSFAANAALAISRNPGNAYNPCLIYGGVGLGKTHLLQSIGNNAYNINKKITIIYVTAETFINDFILSIKDKTQHIFKSKYRSADILLIDDIHFLQKKTETQEELFHTFNALYDSNKQMVFTCDRPVSELRELTDRLRSRFERGLNVDLQPPNYETRIAILKKKIEEKNIKIPDNVIELICRNVTTNVRDLEKALTKLIAYADLVNKNITLQIAQRQLSDFFSNPMQKNISISVIMRVTADYFGLSFNDLKGKKRTKAIAFPRHVAMYISKELTEYSTTEIGLEFGGRDHTTVMHSCQKIENNMKTDPTLEPTINHLIRTIKEFKISY
ncbi:MAG: chromosomal replication initiator protein DnaA [Spirochaetales bacterium]|nr:chromosomal replication initiator protein DnaA [Spirochaetales bacterium]